LIGPYCGLEVEFIGIFGTFRENLPKITIGQAYKRQWHWPF
jgi:hypothetical protein